MSESPKKENWGSKLGVVLAVAGSAVGLGNFLRFPGEAVSHGGGAFMVPYLISFFLLGIPICWCEWTMGRLGGRFGQNNGPGIMHALWRRGPAKVLGSVTLLIPVVVYMYYVVVEAWCLVYAIEYFRGGIAEQFADIGSGPESAGAVVAKSDAYWGETVGIGEHGALLDSSLLWAVGLCFVINFAIIYRGLTKGIETFCKVAMPLLIGCACIILVRALTLPEVTVVAEDGTTTTRSVSDGLGFMWNPQWDKLGDSSVWLAAAGQIFFSLSVGFGLILCYSSYLKKDDDIVLTSLTASSTNEFSEVILGGMIIIPCAFLFLGPDNATGGTFGLGFVTMPAIMHYMPGGQFFGGLWFGLLFLAAVTSSLSMLQPAIAFLEDGFGLKRSASVTILVGITFLGTAPIFYYSQGLLALDHTDFWCNFLMILAGLGQVLFFGWIIGAEKGVREANRGANFQLPRALPFIIRYVTPTFLLIVLGLWSYQKFPGYVDGMRPGLQSEMAARASYEAALTEQHAGVWDPERIAAHKLELLGESGVPSPLPAELETFRPAAETAGERAASNARVALGVFVSLLAFLVFIVMMAHLAIRGRIGRELEAAIQRDPELEQMS